MNNIELENNEIAINIALAAEKLPTHLRCTLVTYLISIIQGEWGNCHEEELLDAETLEERAKEYGFKKE